ncbi:MAG: hypothetical protein ACRDZ3_18475 [Acidimicrobiia bacterium]
METTLEVRWFGPGSPPDAVTGRFDALGASGPQKRTDAYLVLPGNDTLGVKLREGGTAFELKLRQGDDHPAAFPSGPAGRVERWQKWSFPVGDDACRAARLGLPGESLVDVAKSRRLVAYRLGADGTAALARDRAGDGCSVEVTTLDVAGGHWWSVGFEAFGAEQRLADALAAAVAAFFADAGSAEELAGAPSGGYPAWLGEIT